MASAALFLLALPLLAVIVFVVWVRAIRIRRGIQERADALETEVNALRVKIRDRDTLLAEFESTLEASRRVKQEALSALEISNLKIQTLNEDVSGEQLSNAIKNDVRRIGEVLRKYAKLSAAIDLPMATLPEYVNYWDIKDKKGRLEEIFGALTNADRLVNADIELLENRLSLLNILSSVETWANFVEKLENYQSIVDKARGQLEHETAEDARYLRLEKERKKGHAEVVYLKARKNELDRLDREKERLNDWLRGMRNRYPRADHGISPPMGQRDGFG